MVKNLLPLVPRHLVYVEPFAGGASLFWGMKHPEHPKYTTVLNDLNGAIANFYRQLRDNPQELQRLIENTEHGQLVYAEAMEIVKRGEAATVTDAWAWYVAIQQAFAHKFTGGWRTAVTGSNEAAMWDRRVNMERFAKKLRATHVACEDSLRCIERWDSPQTLFYCDPPYVNTDQGYSKGYTQEDFDKLLEALKNAQGSVLLSCYHNDAVPSEWERFNFNAVMTAVHKKEAPKERTEVVWRKWNSVPVSAEVSKLYRSGPWSHFAFPKAEQVQLEMFA